MIYELGWEQLGIINEKSHFFRKLMIKCFTPKPNTTSSENFSELTLKTLVPKTTLPLSLVMPLLVAIPSPDNNVNSINKKMPKPFNIKKSYT